LITLDGDESREIVTIGLRVVIWTFGGNNLDFTGCNWFLSKLLIWSMRFCERDEFIIDTGDGDAIIPGRSRLENDFECRKLYGGNRSGVIDDDALDRFVASRDLSSYLSLNSYSTVS
jgi:hypothetical protein